jgi:peroxiredoxin
MQGRAPTTTAEAFAAAAAMDASVNQRLAAYDALSRPLIPRIADAYDRLLARLSAIDAGRIGPKVGEPMPPFLLPDAAGGLVALDALVEQGPVVVSFNRGHWCPFCRLELRALAAASADIASHGAQIVSIVPEREVFAHRLVSDQALPFNALSDMGLGYAQLLDLPFWIGADLGALYRERGIDLALFQNGTGELLPIPATFVIGADGLVKARFADPDFRRRMEPAAILAAL